MKKIFIIFTALLLLVVFITPAMAKVTIGGIIFTDFYYLDRDKDNSYWWWSGNGETSYGSTTIQVPNISRFYAKWENEDNVGMYVEMGLGQDGGRLRNSRSDGVILRKAYGWWDITPDIQIMAGKSTTPFSPLNPSQLIGTRSGTYNIIGVGYGDYYSGRLIQVRGTYKFNKNIRLAVAAVDPNGRADVIGDYGPWYGWDGWSYQTTTKMPRIDVGLPITIGNFNLYPGILYQQRTVDILNSKYAGHENSLDSYVGSLGFKTGYGALAISAEGNYGKNWGNTRGLIGVSPPAELASAILQEDGQINDAETYSFWIDISYKFGPATPHLIYGQMATKNRYDETELDTKSQMYGISCPIQLAKGFSIRPEVMFYEDGKINASGGGNSESYDTGSYAIYGVQFQVTF